MEVAGCCGVGNVAEEECATAGGSCQWGGAVLRRHEGRHSGERAGVGGARELVEEAAAWDIGGTERNNGVGFGEAHKERHVWRAVVKDDAINNAECMFCL